MKKEVSELVQQQQRFCSQRVPFRLQCSFGTSLWSLVEHWASADEVTAPATPSTE